MNPRVSGIFVRFDSEVFGRAFRKKRAALWFIGPIPCAYSEEKQVAKWGGYVYT